jgi:hypothetical protein
MSSKYQHRRMRKELWGNLGTEEGVDALLETVMNDGENKIVYNKRRWGYTDDDSLFMGGYQQCDPLTNDDKEDEPSSFVVNSRNSPTQPAGKANQ